MTTEHADILIKGGLLVSGEGNSRTDILISNGKVAELGQDLSSRQVNQTIDATGKYLSLIHI